MAVMKDTKTRAAGAGGAAAREERREGGVMGAVDAVKAWPVTTWVRVREFYNETRLEMRRVTWPERKQVQATTIVVIVTVFFFGFYLLVTDKVVDSLLRRFLLRG